MGVVTLAAVLADGISTYLLLHPSQGGTFLEANGLAAGLMGLVGLEGYIFFGNVMAALVIPFVLAASPGSKYQRMVWAGALSTCLLKLAAGSWNFYLYFNFA